MTSEDWKLVEKSLSYPSGWAKMKIDDYDISIYVEQTKNPLQFCLTVYVNGSIKMKDCIEENEIRDKFYNCHSKSLMSAKEKKALKSIVKTKVEKEEIEKKSKYIFYEPYFESFRTMKSKFVKNNSSFVLIETSWNSYI